MKILIIHFGETWEFLASTSVFNGLSKKYDELELHAIVSDDNYNFIQYNKKFYNIHKGSKLILDDFDQVINFTPSSEACCIASHVNAEQSYGFTEIGGRLEFCDIVAENFYRMKSSGKKTNRTILQSLYKLCGLTWRGEGYDVSYYPKARTKKHKTGIAIKDDKLRLYIKNNLKLVLSDIWHIPIKKNLIKRFDEINRCKNIVTDDLFCLHAAIALRKHVEFIDKDNTPFGIEFFGRGGIINIRNIKNATTISTV